MGIATRSNPHAEAGNLDTAVLTRSAGRGALWKLASGGWTTVVRLGASTVLARVLFPRDFGILGMALIVQNLIQRVGILGMTSGVIVKKDVSQDDLSTVFWTDAASRVLMFAVIFAGAPFAATFFDTPELTAVLRVTCLTLLISIFGAVPGMLMVKRLQFKAQAIINALETLLTSGLALIFAVTLRWGYWSLVLASLLGNVFGVAARVIYVRWLPAFRFNGESFRYMFRYGINSLGSSITEYLHQNADYLIVGKLLGPAVLGLYEFAYRIPHLLHARLAKPVAGVIFPTLSKVQTSDQQLVAGYAKASRYLALLTFPLLAGLVAVAEPFVLLMWGEKWMPIVWPMRLLCVLAASRCVFGPLGALYMCKDRPDLPFKIKVFRSAFTFIAVAVLGYVFGFIGVAAGMLFSDLPVFFEVWLVSRMTRSSPLKLIGGLYMPLLCALSCGIVASLVSQVLAIQGSPAWVRLICAVPTGASVYFLIAMLFFRDYVRSVLEDAFLILRRSSSPGSTK